MAKESPLNRKETIKEETLEHQKGKNTGIKNSSRYNRLSLLKFSKLCLMIEAKIISLSDVAINVYKRKYVRQLYQ